MAALLYFKVPALAASMIAEYISYKSPNPPPKKEETEKYNGGDVISHIATVASQLALAFAWSTHAVEIVSILAKDAHTPTSSALLSSLLARASAVKPLSVHPAFVTGFSILLAGAVIRKLCYRTLGRFFTFQLSLLKEHKLVTWGPYAVVRHPSYTGMVMSIVGMLTTQLAPGGWICKSGVLDTWVGKGVIGGWTAFLAFMIVGTVRRVPKEDAVLKKEFGEQWDEWKKKTPYALIPYVY
ncbi:ICMT-domain-containing protein [Cubamyces sp. BRFM 1775]|nr:ICMT-domain-containing protein [Cubamyces sp. BRFM 1775]